MMDRQRIHTMEVEYPTEFEIRSEREKILDAALPKGQSIWESYKRIYIGPGIRNIFYHNGIVWLITVFVYISLCGGCLMMSNEEMGASMLAFPFCFLLHSFLSCWLDEQEGVAELKKSMYFSLPYMAGLRMFYTSIAIMLCNIFAISLLYPALSVERDEMLKLWRIAALGTTSMFLFATVAVRLYHKYSKSRYFVLLMGVWCVFACLLIRKNTVFAQVLLENIPLAIHGIVAVVSFFLFVIYLGKVEKKYAYAFTR